MQIRNQPSQLTHAEEGKPPSRSGPRVTRWLYYSLVLGIVGYLGYLALDRSLYVRGDAEVRFQQTVVSPSREGRILALPLEEGDHFQKGDLIALLGPAESCQEQIDEQITTLETDLATARQRRSALAEQVDMLQGFLRGDRLDEDQRLVRRGLEVGRASDQDQREARIRTSKRKIAQLRAEITVLDAQITWDDERLASLRNRPQSERPAQCREQRLAAPYDGRVYLVKRRRDEFVQAGESLVAVVPEDGDVWVNGYVSVDSLEHVAKGKEVGVTFSDGRSTRGVIAAITSSAHRLPVREEQEHEPAPRFLTLRVQPAEDGSAQLWRQYAGMSGSVKIRK